MSHPLSQHDKLGVKEQTLGLVMLVSMALWNIPYGAELMLPFKLFTTFVHESCHALLMALCGAGVEGIEIFRDTSGYTKSQMSSAPWAKPLIASAGYVGTSLVGATLLMGTKTPKRTMLTLFAFSIVVFCIGIFWSSNHLTFAIAMTTALLALLASVKPLFWLSRVFYALVSLQLCLHAVLDIRVLFNPNLVINGQKVGLSDAHNMAALTFGTPKMWATFWIAFAFILLALSLKVAYSNQGSSPSGPP